MRSAFHKIWFKNNLPCESLLSDNGKQFTSKHFNQIFRERKIPHLTTRVYNPQCNSKSERNNKAINEILRLSKQGKSFKFIINTIEKRLNFTHHRSIKCSPHELMFKETQLIPCFYSRRSN